MDDISRIQARLKDAKKQAAIREKQNNRMARELKKHPEQLRKLSAVEYAEKGFLGGIAIDRKTLEKALDRKEEQAAETLSEYLIYDEKASKRINRSDVKKNEQDGDYMSSQVGGGKECDAINRPETPVEEKGAAIIEVTAGSSVKETVNAVSREADKSAIEESGEIVSISEDNMASLPFDRNENSDIEDDGISIQALDSEMDHVKEDMIDDLALDENAVDEDFEISRNDNIDLSGIDSSDLAKPVDAADALPEKEEITERWLPVDAKQSNRKVAKYARKARRAKAKTIKEAKVEIKKQDNNENPKEKKKKKKPEINYREIEDEVLLVPPLPFTCASHFIPVDSIKKGIIHTSDGRYVRILEVEPANFSLKTPREQNQMISNYIAFQSVAPVSYQIKIVSMRANVERYTYNARADILREKNEGCRKLQESFLKFIQDLSSRRAIARKYFFIISYDGKNTDEEAITRTLNLSAYDITHYLQNCGNVVHGADYSTGAVVELLFSIFNRSDRQKQETQQRLNEVKNYYLENYGKKSLDMIPIAEAFSPISLNFKDHRYVIRDGVYQTILYVAANGYRSSVYGGWIETMIQSGDGVDVDIFVRQKGKEESLSKLRNHLRWDGAAAPDVHQASKTYENLSRYMRAGVYLRNGLLSGQDMYTTCIFITISAGSEKEVLLKSRDVQKKLRLAGFRTETCNFHIEAAYKATMPFNQLPKFFEQKAHRNMLTEGVGSMYPFTSIEMHDDKGIPIGLHKDNSSLMLVDFFDTNRFTNSNIAIMGNSGMGKTFLLMSLAFHLRYQQKQIFVIVPEKGFEWRRGCEAMGGVFASMASSSGVCINPFDIRQRDSSVNIEIDGIEIEDSELIAKVDWLHMLLSVWIKDITGEESNLLSVALMEVYARKGITKDNESLWNDDHTAYKEMPTFSDLYEVLKEKEETRRLSTYLLRLIRGTAQNFNHQTNVDLDNPYIVFDLSSVKGDMMLFSILIVLDLVYGKIKENRLKEKMLLIEEVWNLIGLGADPRVANQIVEFFKLIRSYGGGAIAATQAISDFFGLNKEGTNVSYGELILGVCSTKFVLGLEPKEAKKVQEVLDLSDPEYNQIVNFKRGYGLMCTSHEHVPVEFRTSEVERMLFTTDHRELAEISRTANYRDKNRR